MEHKIELIKNYKKEVWEHLASHLENGYEDSTPSETAITFALVAGYNQLCELAKNMNYDHDKHDDHKRMRHDHDHDEHDGRARR